MSTKKKKDESNEPAEKHTASALSHRILRQGLVPAAQKLVFLSEHAERETTQLAASKAVVAYNLDPNNFGDGTPDEDEWDSGLVDILEDEKS